MARNRRRGRGATGNEIGSLQLTVPRDQFENELNERIAMGEEMLNRPIVNEEGLNALGQEFSVWSDFNQELLRQRFTSSEISMDYKMAIRPAIVGPHDPLEKRLERKRGDIEFKLRRLASVKERLTLFAEPRDEIETSARQARREEQGGSAIFVVHGHNEHVREEVARFLEKLTSLDVNRSSR